jgi:hypothetical protein
MHDCQSAEMFLRSGISLQELIFDASYGPPYENRSLHVPKRKEKRTRKKKNKKSATVDSTMNSGADIENASEKPVMKIKRSKLPRTKTVGSVITKVIAGPGRSPTTPKAFDGVGTPARPGRTFHYTESINSGTAT